MKHGGQVPNDALVNENIHGRFVLFPGTDFVQGSVCGELETS